MEIPDKFNDSFSSRGWIIYDAMSIDVACAAILRAERGDVDGAEEDLVRYYSNDTVRMHLNWMKAVKAFTPRLRLAYLALEDYEEGRYHACIPVTLALLDGLVNELHERHRGFFADDTSLDAWDSIAAHDKGLNALARIWRKSRQKTVTAEIRVPFRNGIVHGMDLGYDNRMVAAKTWAALFAAKDWALKVERGQDRAPAKEDPVKFSSFINQVQESQLRRERWKNWKPRNVEVGVTLPSHGAPDEFEPDSPERSLVEYLQYWIRRNYGHMSRLVPHDVQLSESAMPGFVKERVSDVSLRSFELISVVDAGPSMARIEAELGIERANKPATVLMAFQMVYQNKAGEMAPRGTPDSSWVVYNWTSVP